VPEFTELGYNYKLSDIAAAIMRVQLRRLSALTDRRSKIAASYAQQLGDVPGLTVPVEPDDRQHAWQSYLVTLDPDVDRGAVATELRSRGIGCNFGTYASHLQPVYGETNPCPTSKDLFERHLAIPMHANLTDDAVDRVAAAVRAALAR